jgi:hypothetical protein
MNIMTQISRGKNLLSSNEFNEFATDEFTTDEPRVVMSSSPRPFPQGYPNVGRKFDTQIPFRRSSFIYISIRQACVSIRPHTSAYVSIRQHTCFHRSSPHTYHGLELLMY